jgi:hypothetical protein
MLITTQDNEEIIERVAALDIGKAELCAASGSPMRTIRGGDCRRCRPTRR